ncbi:MAG TPA: HAMP domain-containing sensor histidine kinase [Fimbriimonas sp.]|nr:HAMP domain-containing sensor histidine kinase [Fimbriimonas sp.]
MLRPTLRARLVLWNTIFVGLILALLAVVSYRRVQSSVYDSIEQTLISRSNMLYGLRTANGNALRGDEALLSGASVEILPYLTRPRLLNRDGLSASQLTDKPWDRAGFVGALTNKKPMFTEAEAPEGPIRVYSRPIFDSKGDVKYVLQHVYLLNEAEAAVDGVKQSFITIAPLALLIIIGGAILIAGRTARPIAKMASDADSISASELDARLQERGTRELATLARAFNSLLDRLQEAFDRQKRVIDSQRNFIADASNELRAPLEAIKASAERALNNGGDPRAALEQVSKATAETDELVSQMLAMARAESRMGDYRAAQELFPILLDVYERWEPVMGERLELQASRRLPSVMGDERQLKEALDNLLQNCARYAPDASVVVSAEELDGCVLIQVKDNGPGISQADLDRVFDRFYRGQTERHIQGAGLGLSIAKEIIEAHGGTIAADSTNGKGTTIAIRLPTKEPDSDIGHSRIRAADRS